MITMYTEDEPAQKKKERKRRAAEEKGREFGTGQANTGVDRERQAGR
jgi:hypothetical protein